MLQFFRGGGEGRGGEGRGWLISCEARAREKSSWVSFFFVRAPKASCNTLTPMLATHLSYHLFLINRKFDSGRRNLQPPGELMPFFTLSGLRSHLCSVE